MRRRCPLFILPCADSLHCIRVAENLYIRSDWEDTMYKRILTSKLGPSGKYVYSDNDFIFMGKIVEALSGQTLDQYAYTNFYQPLALTTRVSNPVNDFLSRIAPTEQEVPFRRQLLRGDVHDPGAAMFGEVSGMRVCSAMLRPGRNHADVSEWRNDGRSSIPEKTNHRLFHCLP